MNSSLSCAHRVAMNEGRMPWIRSGFAWFCMAAAIAFAPLLAAFFVNLWSVPEYEFFPQALAAAGFLAWSRLRQGPEIYEPGARRWLAWLFIGATVPLTACAVALWSPWLAAVCVLVIACAVVWIAGGASLLSSFGPAFVVAATIVPPPLALDERLSVFLRDLATVLSSRLLDFAGVIHAISGNVIEIPGERLFVEEACSGIHSVVFVTSFTIFYFLWRRRPSVMLVLAIPAALLFVLFGNVIRISLGAWLRVETGVDLLTGWKHEMLSIVLVGAYIGLVISLECLLCRKPPRPWPGPAKARWFDGLSLPRAGAVAWIFAAVFALLSVGSIRAGISKLKESGGGRQLAGHSETVDFVFSLPDRIGEWERVESVPRAVNRIETIGLSSILWRYRWRDTDATVAFDYPIHGYHDVADCYSRTGWTITAKEPPDGSDGRRPFVAIDLRRDNGTSAALWYSTFNLRGEALDRSTMGREFLSRFLQFGVPQGTSYRVQVLITGDKPPGVGIREAARDLLEDAAAILHHQLREAAKQ